jgi:hypothetical protein
MDQPLPAHTFNEVRYYLMVTPCCSCGKGPWSVDDPPTVTRAHQEVTVQARCQKCLTVQPFRFLCQSASATADPEAECINPTDSPSRLVDPAQWLSLFYLLVESAAAETSRSQTRLGGYRAALCLAEALKFYGDDELPPESAFLTPVSAAAFREHPEKFARQRLRDMQSKLPSLPVMARRLTRDHRARRRWWQFWKT